MPVYLVSAAARGIQFPVTAPGSCTPMNDCGLIRNQILFGGGARVTAKGVTMAQLAGDLGPYFDLPVVEQTGSSKRFDVDLSFTKDDLAVSDTNGRSPGSRVGDEPSALPTIFDALKKAGLSATRGQGAVEVLVIDQLERPSEN
jgi:uncharacterized protein (TIGR03435 family)